MESYSLASLLFLFAFLGGKGEVFGAKEDGILSGVDRKSTRLNSSHVD